MLFHYLQEIDELKLFRYLNDYLLSSGCDKVDLNQRFTLKRKVRYFNERSVIFAELYFVCFDSCLIPITVCYFITNENNTSIIDKLPFLKIKSIRIIE